MRRLAMVLLTLALSACATSGSRPADCVLGVNPTEVPQSLWDDSLDALITHAVDQRKGWTCPPPRRTT